MRILTRLIPALIVGALLSGLGPQAAQAGGRMVDPNPGPLFVPPLPTPADHGNDAGSAAVGQAVYRALTAASAFCAALPDDTYQIDCLSDQLAKIYRSMPETGPYAETRAALQSAAAQLRAVVEANRDGSRTAGKSFATASGDSRTSRRLQPVAPARKAAAVAEAVAIIEQTQTVLLRSSETVASAEARPQIERIAAAVGSNKVLLRSA